MPIEKTPRVEYYEENSNPLASGDGAEIPIIIGISGNETPVEGVKKFKNYKQAFAEVSEGGIGTDVENNPILSFLKNFFAETNKKYSDDIGVPYVYVIDVGTADISNEEGKKAFTDAMNLAKTKRDVTAEIFVGFKKEESLPSKDVVALMNAANTCIIEDSKHGNPRIAYFSVEGATDEDLISLTDDSGAKGTYIQEPRVGLAEPELFPQIIGHICITPYYEEPGYTDFRSVKEEDVIERTEEQEQDLQDAGILFARKELTKYEIHNKICLSVSTAFATNSDLRPNDAVLHQRRNVDHLIREVYDVLYSQLKRNETQTNLSFLQSDVDTLVNAEIDDGYMMDGTKIKVQESEVNPYDLKVEGVAVPVNSTLLIGFGMYVEGPNMTVTRLNE